MRSLDRIPDSSRESPAEDIPQRLRDLPGETQPPYGWQEFRHRARSGAWPRRSAVKWEHAAAAAGVTALVASMAMWVRADHHAADVVSSGVAPAPWSVSGSVAANDEQAHEQSPTGSNDSAGTRAHTEVHDGARFAAAGSQEQAVTAAVQAAVASQLAALSRAQTSRRWLDNQPAEPAVVRVGSHLVVANLEDRIAWVDDALTDAQLAQTNAARVQTLQQQRARLVTSLAQVRYAETLASQMP